MWRGVPARRGSSVVASCLAVDPSREFRSPSAGREAAGLGPLGFATLSISALGIGSSAATSHGARPGSHALPSDGATTSTPLVPVAHRVFRSTCRSGRCLAPSQYPSASAHAGLANT